MTGVPDVPGERTRAERRDPLASPAGAHAAPEESPAAEPHASPTREPFASGVGPSAPSHRTPDEPHRRYAALAVLGLLSVTAAWGSTFFMIKDLVTRIPVPDFLAVRFTIAAVVMAAIAHRPVLRMTPTARRRGLLLGTVYGLAQVLQTAGLEHTDASISGFVTAMYVVITPVLAALLLRHRISGPTLLAVASATAGLAVLSLRPPAAGWDVLGYGELLTLGSAALYALHIVGLAAWTTGRDALGLSVVQLAVIAAVCTVAATPGGLTLPATSADWASVLYMAMVPGAYALLVQSWSQAHLPAARAAIIMCLEPVWAAAFALVFGGEALTGRLVLGGGLILAATYVTELAPRRPSAGGRRRADVTDHDRS